MALAVVFLDDAARNPHAVVAGFIFAFLAWFFSDKVFYYLHLLLPQSVAIFLLTLLAFCLAYAHFRAPENQIRLMQNMVATVAYARSWIAPKNMLAIDDGPVHGRRVYTKAHEEEEEEDAHDALDLSYAAEEGEHRRHA